VYGEIAQAIRRRTQYLAADCLGDLAVADSTAGRHAQTTREGSAAAPLRQN